MRRRTPTCWWRAAPIAAAVIAAGAAPGFAQGTAVEREACTPDALKLCSDTIPDIPKTTACMRAHQAELSPRCRAVIAARAEASERTRASGFERRVDRDARGVDFDRGESRFNREMPPPDDEGPGERRYLYLEPNGEAAEAPDPYVRARARAELERLCDEEMIDPRTCDLSERALR